MSTSPTFARALHVCGWNSVSGSSQGLSDPSSFRCASMSTYCNPFCSNEMSAPGGTSALATEDFITRLSYANVNAAWVNPDSWRYRYTRKFTSSEVIDMGPARVGTGWASVSRC